MTARNRGQTPAPASCPPMTSLPPTAAMTQNISGGWVPSVPLPFYGLRKRCECGRRFWTTAAYRGHYALVHILGLAS